MWTVICPYHMYISTVGTEGSSFWSTYVHTVVTPVRFAYRWKHHTSTYIPILARRATYVLENSNLGSSACRTMYNLWHLYIGLKPSHTKVHWSSRHWNESSQVPSRDVTNTRTKVGWQSTSNLQLKVPAFHKWKAVGRVSSHRNHCDVIRHGLASTRPWLGKAGKGLLFEKSTPPIYRRFWLSTGLENSASGLAIEYPLIKHPMVSPRSLRSSRGLFPWTLL